MLKRKAAAVLKHWVKTRDKKCLVVQGARQTGKTYIIERFAEENFEEVLEINFKEMPSAREIFAGENYMRRMNRTIAIGVSASLLLGGCAPAAGTNEQDRTARR